MQSIHTLLDRYTTYQVVTTTLVTYIVAAFGLSFLGLLTYPSLTLGISLIVILGVSLAAHKTVSSFYGAPANVWSTVITALILFLLFTPTIEVKGLFVLALISLIAVVGKYVVQYRNAHIVNPVVLTAVLVGVSGIAHASWWVGSAYLMPVVVIGGIAIVLKIRRTAMVIAGLVASVVMVGVQSTMLGSLSLEVFVNLFMVSPLIFFMTIMVTEPLTTPAGTRAQVLYGVFIGLLSNIPFAIGPIFNSPEVTLLVANVLAYPLSIRGRLTLVCQSVKQVARETYEYAFTPSYNFIFKPGQYLEWALPHNHPDSRGTRRYFTIASAPTEPQIKITVREAENGSSFKRALTAFNEEDVIYATQLAGDFVLPENLNEHKYLFIAGGIGVTPFCSQIKYLLDTKQPINAHLFYCNKTIDDIAYDNLFKRAENEVGVALTHVLNSPPMDWAGEVGYINADMLHRHVPDVSSRLVYISGPPAMVGSYTSLVRKMGVPAKNIKTDYFPGLA